MFIIWGILIITFGVMIIIKTEWILNNFGRIGWFEQHLGLEGGSRLGYRLIGLLVVFIGLLVLTDMIGGFIRFITYPLTKFN